MNEYIFKIDLEQSGVRLDLALAEFAKKNNLGASRTFAQKIIKEGKVSINGQKVVEPNYKIKTNDQIKWIFEDKKPGKAEAEDIPLEVVYEDNDLAIINKQIGLVTHPAPGNYEHTLVNAILHRFKSLSDINTERPGIVHRLDKDTSGLMVVAKNNAAHLKLTEQFAQHSIKRKYIALVSGKVEFDENIIEMPIGRHPLKRKSMAVGFGANTKYAKTFYRTLKRSENFSLLELEPFTGRTHQLRVHLAFIGHPILGDQKYGNKNDFPRLALHAKSLGFIHPSTEKLIEFSSDTPHEFLDLFKK